MNLKSIRKQIKNITDYSPDLSAFNTQLDEIINNSYFSLWVMKQWSFTKKENFISFHPDIKPSRDTANGVPNANVIKGDRRVTLSAGIDRLTSMWEGQPMSIQGREYIISKVVSPQEILLVEPFAGATAVDETEWVIKMRWYTLPSDLVSVQFMGMRQYPINSNTSYKYTAIQQRREEEVGLDADRVSDNANIYISGSPKVVMAGETLRLSDAVATGAVFPLNSYIEVCWCFDLC